MLVLLGPSGCGKSTLLRCLAGLESPTQGTIEVDGQTFFDGERRIDLSPDRRSLGMVFQSYALWPHMTVLENIRFPLRARRMKRALAEGWAEQAAEMVSCTPLLGRYPGELSGGQQQRIALARAVVARPSVLLFDEPLSNLDARLRGDLRMAIRELHTQLGFTGVYVTHDQEEGLTVGDKIAVLNAGQLIQVGVPEDVHREPATNWVADFMGMTNSVTVEGNLGRLTNGSHDVGHSNLVNDGEVLTLRFRPEDVDLCPPDRVVTGDTITRLFGWTVDDVAFAGNFTEFFLHQGDLRIAARVEGGLGFVPARGDLVDVLLPEPTTRAFDASGSFVRSGLRLGVKAS
jgi:iron(III) transport system ATP-binding protein